MNGRSNVWDEVEAFRTKYLAAKRSELPVDVFSLVELTLQMDVIPFDDLFQSIASMPLSRQISKASM